MISLQLLEANVVNYFFLCLIASHENIIAYSDIKIIKRCLAALISKKIIYVGTNLDKIASKNNEFLQINFHLYQNSSPQSVSFALIACIIFFSNMQKTKLS